MKDPAPPIRIEPRWPLILATLAFATAMAFSPTDALPLTSRAKLMMMLESTVSLLSNGE